MVVINTARPGRRNVRLGPVRPVARTKRLAENGDPSHLAPTEQQLSPGVGENGRMSGSIPFEELEQADLLVDRVYESGPSDNVGADPLQRLLPVGNQGGIRYKGSVQGDDIRLVVLYTSGEHPDWPDSVDPYTGTGAYFGDNRRPGQELHATTRQGNEILRLIFDRANGDCTARAKVPPVWSSPRAIAGATSCSGAWQCQVRQRLQSATNLSQSGAPSDSTGSRTIGPRSRSWTKP